MPALKTQVISPIIGIDVSKPGDYVDARATTNAQNAEIKRGIIQQKQGCHQLGSTLGERIMGVSELENGASTFLIRVGLTKVEVLDKSTDTWSSIANTVLAGAETDLISFSFPLISAERNMVFTNGVDAIRKTDGGTDADLGGTPPLAKFVLDFGTYLLLGNVTDAGTNFFTRVQWSDTGDPEQWVTGNAGSTELLEDSLEITGMHVWGDFVAVHKESGIWLGQLVSTSDVFKFSRRETAGTISNGTIQNLPTGEQIFLARDGIRLFNGTTSTLINSPIIDELRDSMNPEFVNRSTSVLVKDLDEYWVAIPIGSEEDNSTIYKYNYRTGQVFRDTRENLTTLALTRRTSQAPWDSDSDSWNSDTSAWDSVVDLNLHKQVTFGDSAGISSQRDTTANDIAVAIDSIWDSKDFTILDIDPQKPIGTMVRFDKVELWAKGDTVTSYYSTDGGSTWNLITTTDLDSDYPTDATADFLYFDVVTSRIRFRFRNDRGDESWALKQFWISAKPREVRN